MLIGTHAMSFYTINVSTGHHDGAALYFMRHSPTTCLGTAGIFFLTDGFPVLWKKQKNPESKSEQDREDAGCRVVNYKKHEGPAFSRKAWYAFHCVHYKGS